MLIARAPMRISFGGGGTDLEAYYARYGGLVISTAINKYFYAVITTDESDDLQVISADYRSLFRHSPYNDLFWDGDLALPKAILHHFGIRRGINLFVASEVPPGTGLGSSSAAAVTMVRAISTLVEQPMTRQQVAEAYWSCLPIGIPILLISIYEASSATCCLVIGCSTRVEMARTIVTAAALEEPRPVPGGTSLATKRFIPRRMPK